MNLHLALSGGPSVLPSVSHIFSRGNAFLHLATSVGRSHCGLYCALGGSLGINIASFPLHSSLWNIQSEKHFSAYFQMLWNYLYPILTHFYWIKSFMSLVHKRREIRENKVKNTAKLAYSYYLNSLKFWPNQLNFCLCSIRFLNKMLKKNHFLAHLAHFAYFSSNQISIFTFIHIITCPF